MTNDKTPNLSINVLFVYGDKKTLFFLLKEENVKKNVLQQSQKLKISHEM
jgi:hypothetical protein